ncbi:unnamed protein product, partial [Trichogramma brassicae]
MFAPRCEASTHTSARGSHRQLDECVFFFFFFFSSTPFGHSPVSAVRHCFVHVQISLTDLDLTAQGLIPISVKPCVHLPIIIHKNPYENACQLSTSADPCTTAPIKVNALHTIFLIHHHTLATSFATSDKASYESNQRIQSLLGAPLHVKHADSQFRNLRGASPYNYY